VNIREERGIQIAQKSRIQRVENFWVVPSQSGNGAYLVKMHMAEFTCTCPDYELMQTKCKHIFAVEYKLQSGIKEVVTGETKKKSYSQNWPKYDKAQITEQANFQKLLFDLCNGIEEPQYGFGRPKLSLKEMFFISCLKVYSTFSYRRFMCLCKEAKHKEYVTKVPCYASISHFLQKKEITPILQDLIGKSAIPLKTLETNFAVDSSGFSSSRFEKWFNFKYGKETSRKSWIKAHLVCGTRTNIITSVKLMGAWSADSPQFKPLIEETANLGFNVVEVTADKAYSSRQNYDVVKKLGGQAYIPFRSNATGKSRGSKLWRKMFHYFEFNRDEFMKHYHKRSNVETTFHMIKSKFGDAVRSRDKTAQVNEVLCKILCHNICVLIHEMQNSVNHHDFISANL